MTGRLIAGTEVSHTHVEWLRFLKQIARQTRPGLDLHLIADNYATHKHPKVQAWRRRGSKPGCGGIPAPPGILRRHRRPGSIWSSASSPI
jgi:hypothetical protein